jgi:iron complex outermembrane recepter protein
MCCVFAMQAQFKIGGLLQNELENPIADAAVVISDAKGKEIANFTSGPKGFFMVQVPSAGKYVLTVSAKNCKTYSKQIDVLEDIRLGKIQLWASNKLDAVKVTADKVVVKTSVDKKIYNVGQDITASGGSASDVMRNIPSVTVDPVDGDLAIRGNENILVLIDGKPSTLLGTDIATILQGIPASTIESVEVVNNPGAQYDAQGKGGVLNIILKKDRKPGYNANIGVNIGYPYRANANIGVNANVKKWNFFANISGRTSNTFIKERIERSNSWNDITNLTTAYTSRIPKNGFINLGMDYTANKKNKFSLSQNAFLGDMGGDITTDITTDSASVKRIQSVNRFNTYVGQPRNTTTSFNYTNTSGKFGQELKVDASMGFSQYIRQSDIETDTTNVESGINSTNNIQSIPVKGGNNNYTISSDFTTQVSPKSKLDIGVKNINFAFRSENFPTRNKTGETPIIDIPLKNKYKFSQVTYAAYANYKTSFRSLNIQTGLRLEHFVYDGFVYQINTPLFAKFTNLFPSIYISKKTQKNAEITVSYTKRVNRPNFFQMVPYIDVTNPVDTSVGNPNLAPEFIHATELSYSLPFSGRNTLLASVYYQYNNNLIQRFKRFNTNGTTFTQPQNINYGNTYGAEVNVKFYLIKNWDVSINGNVFNNIINGQNLETGVSTSGWSGFAKLISNFKLNKQYDMQVTGNYNGPAIVAQGRTRSFYNIDAGIKANYFKNMLTISANANDIFNTTFLGTEYVIPNQYQQYNYRKPLTQQFTIGAQFRWMSKNTNPADAKDRKFGKRGGAEKENKDVKNRDENLKKDEREEDSNNNNNNSGGQGNK